MKTGKISISVLAALLLTGTWAQAAMGPVYFLHRTDKQEALQLDCDAEQQAGGPTAYTCYDEQGNEQVITPGPEWQLAELSQACLRNTVTDTVRDCLAVAAPGEQPELYVCRDKKGKFFRPSVKWQRLPADDRRCAPLKQEAIELIRSNGSAAPPSRIEWSSDHAGEE